jgi:hypothetical protein
MKIQEYLRKAMILEQKHPLVLRKRILSKGTSPETQKSPISCLYVDVGAVFTFYCFYNFSLLQSVHDDIKGASHCPRSKFSNPRY